MITKTFFTERKGEINAYFDFLENVVVNKAKLIINKPIKSSRAHKKVEIDIEIDLTHTLKANGFLLMYNLVEATLSAAIEEIHDCICADDHLGADELVESLTTQAISRVNKNIETSSPISKSILQHWIDDHKSKVLQNKNPLFNGNVDGRVIKEVAKIYGFSADARGKTAKNGTTLVKVKTKRNELAHGKISFSDCGRDISIDELNQIQKEVIAYLEKILNNIEDYIENKSYLRTA